LAQALLDVKRLTFQLPLRRAILHKVLLAR